MWGLFVSQGCLVYTGYLYISWLPNYLQTARHLSILNSGIYTAIPFLISTVVGILANWVGDRLLTADAVAAAAGIWWRSACCLWLRVWRSRLSRH